MSGNEDVVLYTGHDLLPKGESKTQQFGSLSSWTKPKEKGTVRLMFNKSDVNISQSDVDHVIELPEEYAIQLAEKLRNALVRLEHLRNLHKLGRLNQNAYYENKQDEGLYP